MSFRHPMPDADFERRVVAERMGDAKVELERAKARVDRANDFVAQAAMVGDGLDQARAGQEMLRATMHLQDRFAVAKEWGVM